jgi:hypothetical protein
MLILATTTDVLRIVTGSAGDIQVYAAWMDNASGTVTPGKTGTLITTATTTTVVAAPAASTQRNVKSLNITNNSTTLTCQIGVQVFDGTNSFELREVTLLPGENLAMEEFGEWHHRDAQNGDYTYTVPASGNLGITGTIAETFPRELCTETNSTVPSASGTLWLQAIYLTAGQLVSNISISSATTAAGTPTNGFVALFDGSRNLLAQSANQTTTAWAANTLKTLAMTTPYRVTVSGLYYIGVMFTATTIQTCKGNTARVASQLAGTAPIVAGNSTTGLTTTLPNPAAAITVSTASLWAAVS